MVTVKVKKNSNPRNDYLRKGCEYVLNPEKAIDVGGYGVNPCSVDDSYNQMMSVKGYYGKTSGNPLIHVIISYDKSVTDSETACSMSNKCAEYYADNYQVLYCTHEKDRSCSHYHTHMLINSVSFNNGMMFNSNIPNMNKFCNYVSDVTGQKTKLFFEK